MKPTDAMLNEATWKALGWELYKGCWFRTVGGVLQQRLAQPDFVNDKTVTPELWEPLQSGVTDCKMQTEFMIYLAELNFIHYPKLALGSFKTHCSPPRFQVIAFLRTMNAWQKEWELPK